jgi:hypothetical protein
MVQLAALQPTQRRRGEYYYPTTAEQQATIARFDSNQRRLERKLKRLAEISGDETSDGLLQQAKEEYDNGLGDLRDKDLLAQFGREQLVELKDEAKVLFSTLCADTLY